MMSIMEQRESGIENNDQAEHRSKENRLKRLLRGLLAAVIHSRLQPGYNMPITEDGLSLKEAGLKGVGWRETENGNLEEIPPQDKGAAIDPGKPKE